MEGETVEIFYNDTEATVSKRVAAACTVELRDGLLVGVDAYTGQGFLLPVQRVVRIEGDPVTVRRIFAGIPAGAGQLTRGAA